MVNEKFSYDTKNWALFGIKIGYFRSKSDFWIFSNRPLDVCKTFPETVNTRYFSHKKLVFLARGSEISLKFSAILKILNLSSNYIKGITF